MSKQTKAKKNIYDDDDNDNDEDDIDKYFRSHTNRMENAEN